MKLKNTIEIAKVGTWNDFEMTPEILEEAAQNSDLRIPIRRGHTDIKPGQASEGHLENLRFDGNAILADQILMGNLAKEWQEERFINRSIDLSKRGDKYFISAMALLGAEAPGVKGLKTFKEDQVKILRFTEKLNEVIMAEFKDWKEAFEAGRQAERDALKLQFSEKEKKTVDEITLKFNEKIEKVEKENKELKTKLEDQKKLQFNEKIDEVIKTVPEKDQEVVKTELLKFSETLPYDLFAKVADKYKVEPIKIENQMQFSETAEKQDFDYNKQDLKCY